MPKDLWPDVSLWEKITVIDLRLNPWVCDCHNEWIFTSLYKHIKTETPSEFKAELIIKGPFRLRYKSAANYIAKCSKNVKFL